VCTGFQRSMKMELKTFDEDQLLDKICVLIGTRPSIMKMGPIIQELKILNIDHFVIHAGQHYSFNMDQIFFEDLVLSSPNFRLKEVKDYKFHGEQTAEMLKGIERILLQEKPKIILVCGDANFNLAGAIAGRKLHIKVGHVESGLRSNDWRMPEEHNRVMIDHISDYLFAPTEKAMNNLLKDNVKGQIFVHGNTIVDSVLQYYEKAKVESDILKTLDLTTNGYFLLTLHREENVDFVEILNDIVEALCSISKQHPNYRLLFPIHPRTADRLRLFDLKNKIEENGIILVEPVGYLDFLVLIKNARLILTDSGGIQEESCILHTPCVTLRESTERPETVEVGSNIVVGTSSDGILAGVNKMMKKKRRWKNPFGDGTTSKKIIKTILQEFEV
jgi:UDP-N-acetylglucosamine 2-epimerase (non-hydrolysing)